MKFLIWFQTLGQGREESMRRSSTPDLLILRQSMEHWEMTKVKNIGLECG